MLGLGGVAEIFFSRGLAFIDFDILDSVGGNVFKHEVVVAIEEILAVEKQRLDKFTIDLDLSVVVELDTGQLSDETVEHRTLGKLKSIGIIDNSVAFVVEFDFGRNHGHFFKLTRRPFHKDYWNTARGLTLSDIVESVRNSLSGIALAHDIEHECRIFFGYIEIKRGHVNDFAVLIPAA